MFQLKRFAIFILLFASCNASALNLAQKPLFLANASIPNVVLMLDDSGSMDWEILTKPHFDYCGYVLSSRCGGPETGGLSWPNGSTYYYYLFSHQDSGSNVNAYSQDPLSDDYTINNISYFSETYGDWRLFSSDLNVMYFNPDETYSPWSGSFSDASFTAARSHPVSGEGGYGTTRDLTGSFYVVATDSAGYDGTRPNNVASDYTVGASGTIDGWDNHTIYQINGGTISRWQVTYATSGGSVVRTATALADITDADQVASIQQNFANWYQYFRRRSFVVNSAVGELVESSPNYRYALGMINQSNENSFLTGSPSDNSALDTHNSGLLTALYAKDQLAVSTPLRLGLNYAGLHLKKTSSPPITESCQQNFSVLFTDGFWGGGTPSGIGNADSDPYSVTVADVAKYYYDQDLSTLDDNVPVSDVDPANHQHMSTFTVAFGVEGDLTDSDNDGWPDSGGTNLTESSDWGNPISGTDVNSHKINDLWHAAFNSKAIFSSAGTPAEVSDGLSEALAEVDRRVGSASSVASNSGRLQNNSRLYQARFNSSNWTGDLWALPLGTNGVVGSTTVWQAAADVDATSSNDRVIIVADKNEDDELEGKAFRTTSDNLSEDFTNKLIAGKTTLGVTADDDVFVTALVSYLRGTSSSSLSAYNFRTRASKLGDLIHSDPVYSQPPSAPHTETSYQTFKTANAGRADIIYVGGNDGMLHGFDAATGDEVLGFIPYTVADNLYHLADPDYSHQYYVDGQITVADAYGFGDSESDWNSLLVGGLRAGGRGIYALNVTDPDFSEADANNIFLWEFNSVDDGDLGYTFGKPLIVKLATGNWGVIIGNGYDSDNGRAVLYILDAVTGEPLTAGGKIDTGADGSNGLSSPTAVDIDRDGDADYVYAGDLKGNLWKFDISSGTPSEWGVAYSSGSTKIPLFAAGTAKPITVAPEVGRHPSEPGYIVYFGTGKYFEINDNQSTGQTTQSFYGIWDQDPADSAFNASIPDSSLLVQTITNEIVLYPNDTNNDGNNNSQDEASTLRFSSNNDICWSNCASGVTVNQGWKIDLTYSGSNRGEKQVTRPYCVMGESYLPLFNRQRRFAIKVVAAG